MEDGGGLNLYVSDRKGYFSSFLFKKSNVVVETSKTLQSQTSGMVVLTF